MTDVVLTGWVVGSEIERLACRVRCEAGEGPHRDREGPKRMWAGRSAALTHSVVSRGTLGYNRPVWPQI